MIFRTVLDEMGINRNPQPLESHPAGDDGFIDELRHTPRNHPELTLRRGWYMRVLTNGWKATGLGSDF